MTAILSEKVGSFTFMDAVGVAASKMVVERLLSPVVGNASLQSGAIKMALGFAAGHVLPKGKITNYLMTGLVVDAGEDLVMGSGVLSMFGGVTQNAGSAIMRV